ncbi:MAG TPA: hypothetical protein VFS02_02870, partial [Telluria sp.]|nr:hypothetical protein [Telluria sp.]
MNTDELNAAIVNREGQILTLRGEIAKLKNFIVERHGVVGGLMMDVARLLAEADAAARAAPGVPADVLAAVDRMCMPLDPSMLGGVTAEEDARCMAKIKRFIDGLAAPAAPLPNNEAQAQAAEAKLYRDLTGDVVRLGFGGLAEAV